MNHIKDLEVSVDVEQIPIKYLIGVHRLSEKFPTIEDIEWEIIDYCFTEEKKKFTVKSLGRRIFEETINDKQEQFLNKIIKLLIENNKLKNDDRVDRYIIQNNIYSFND